MAEVVAGLLVSALVGIAKNKLASAIAGQASLLWNFGDDLEEMMDHLDTISAVLVDAERQSMKKEVVRLWLKRLKHAALDISDMLEDYQGTSDQAKAKMVGVLSCLPVVYKKLVVANRMRSLKEKLRKIVKEIGIFNFNNDSSTNNGPPYDDRETTSYLPKGPVVGRDREKQEIINLLSANTNNNDDILIVAIYGLGGLGKSTLAQLVYNDAHFKKYDYRIWVYVSQDFNLNKIESSIISQLPTQEVQQNMGTRQVMKKQIDKLLDDKKVLVILDDLWEEKVTELEKLRRLLHIKGSKVDVIVTTRNKKIAIEVSTGEPYMLQNLEDDKCWEIIKKSSKFEVKSNKEEMEKVGFNIAKKCGGVALAAQAVGFMLRSIDDLSGWTEINDSGIWNGSSDDSDVLPSLKLSYERMPPHLRICFSYCAIFPKGHNIIEDYLIQQWTALDFIEQSKGKECINKLLGMSFLQVSKLPLTSQGHVVRYTMHDLVHDLARLTMEDEFQIFDVAPQRNTHVHKYCRYSLLRKYDGAMNLTNMPSKLRALHLSVSGELDIPSGAFSFAKCLRTLDFSECSGIMLPASIGRLKHLRCLIAPRINNDSLPECITELSKLQYLNINGSSKITELPRSIGKLGCLNCLCLSGCSGISKLAESFGDLKCMVHLDMSGCSGLTELPASLSNLTHLQHLELSGCSSVKAVPESIGKLGCLRYICLSGCSGISKLPKSFGDLKSMVHIDMSGCVGITELPESFGDLKSMVHLDLSGCSGLIELPDSLGMLTNLQHLKLSECSSVKVIPETLCGLRQLKYLNMSHCAQIKELPETLVKLQNLLHLDLSSCCGMQHLGRVRGLTALEHLDISKLWLIGVEDLSGVFVNLTNLKYLGLRSYIILMWGLKGCASYIPDSISGMTNLQHLDLSGNITLSCLPASIGNLERLHTLDLTNCRSLKSLPESIRALGLKSLVLHGCSDALQDQASSLVQFSQILPDFKVRVEDVDGCSNLPLLEGAIDVSELRLRCLENVRYLEEAKKVKLLEKQNLSKLSLAWTWGAVRHLEDKDLFGQLVPPRGLKHLCLHGYSSAGFPGWLMDISRHLTNFVCIRLDDMPTCSNLPPLGQLPHLEKLKLKLLPAIKRIDREFCGGKGAFRRLSSFCISSMKGLEEWNTTYSSEDGVKFMFPVLDELKIKECPRLRLKPFSPTFHECFIRGSDQVVSSLEDQVDHSSRPCSPSRAFKLTFILGESCQSMRLLFQQFPALRELIISESRQKSLPESMQHLTSLESLELYSCYRISALPEWLEDLSSLNSLVISDCRNIESLPSCIQNLPKLQEIKIRYSPKLKEWCESEENKAKLAHINVQVSSLNAGAL